MVLNDDIAMEFIVRKPYKNFKVKRGEANRDSLNVEGIQKIEEKRIHF